MCHERQQQRWQPSKRRKSGRHWGTVPALHLLEVLTAAPIIAWLAQKRTRAPGRAVFCCSLHARPPSVPKAALSLCRRNVSPPARVAAAAAADSHPEGDPVSRGALVANVP